MKATFKVLFILIIAACVVGFNLFEETSQVPTIPISFVLKQDLNVEIKTVGELEAARSITIASSLKGDQGKIIDLVADGVYVKPGQILVKLDPSPFEEKIEKLNSQIKEQQSFLYSVEQALQYEILQSEHKNRIAQLEVEAAQIELDKIVYGDGPQEASRLRAAMQKAFQKYDELNMYSKDLEDLHNQGFLNATEVKHAEKKLEEERETYDIAKQQYENYMNHVFPMLVKKGETHLKRTEVNLQEMSKLGEHQTAKSQALIYQAEQQLDELYGQLDEAKQELKQTEVVAPSPGMVVLREEYRNGQKRKPRIGDHLIKNQPIIDLPDLSYMIVKTKVREVDLHKISEGKKTTIEVDAYPNLFFEGTIKSIGVLALSDSGRPTDEKYFEVRIELAQSDSRLRPGMTSRAVIHAQQAKEVLTIPLHSVFNSHRQDYCYLCRPHHKYEKKQIQLGISNEQWVEVKSGLKEGDCICLVNPCY